MNILDDINEIKKIDEGNILGSIIKLPQQVEQAWREIKDLSIPENYKGAKNIIVSGMGGSALGGRVVDALTLDNLRTPLEVFTELKLPKYASQDSLVILSSYSGNTAETLASAEDALEKKAMIVGIGTGGKLMEFLKNKQMPFYLISPVANPSNQPRMGLGYSIAAILSILSKLNFLDLSDSEITSNVRTMGEFVAEFGADVELHNNLAKSLAEKLKNQIPVLIASEHLMGSVHAFKNQLNENAKTFSTLFDIPELNHHLLEGLMHPATVKEHLAFVFFESDLYPKEIIKRYPLTREVVEKNDVKTLTYKLRSETKLEQIFELLVFGSFVSLYLSVIYHTNPAPIPWVDFFKAELAKR